MKKLKMILHGECIIKELNKLPDKISKKNKQDSITIAQSETVGNEHRIKINSDTSFFMDKKGVLFMQNLSPTAVYCLHTNRHDTITIPEGVWQIDRAVEYDYFQNNVVYVSD